jgi:hypothetical protein
MKRGSCFLVIWVDTSHPKLMGIIGYHSMKRATVSLLALTACGAPLGDPSHEIIETSKGVVENMVTLKTTPSIKSGSLADAARDWQSFGWAKVNATSCKKKVLLDNQSIEAYDIKITGYAPDNVPTYHLRLCAS